MRIKSFGLLCVFILVSQMLLTNCEKQKERKKGKQGIEDGRKKHSEFHQENEKGQKPKGGKLPRGKFKNKENVECTWAATGMKAVTVRVDCKHGDSEFWCEFSGDPSACAEYTANQKLYWKQVSRSLKKQKQICQDPKSVLKPKVCKQASRSARLKLTRSSLLKSLAPLERDMIHLTKALQTPAAASVTEKKPEQSPQDCVEDIDYIDQKKVAEEYCPESLLSFCNFFITMVQDKKC